MIQVWNVGEQGVARINRALGLLCVFAPSHYHHLRRVVRGITFDPAACDDGLACTGGKFNRVVVLVVHPMRRYLINLAVTLSHEARHYEVGPFGFVYPVEHTCIDCTDPFQRAFDPIYREDERLRSRLWDRLHA